MNRFQAWCANFMRGRYGYDELTRAVFTVVVVVLVVSVVCNLIGHIGGALFYAISRIANLAATALILYSCFRCLSKNHAARRAENDRYMARRANVEQKRGRKAAGSGGPKASTSGIFDAFKKRGGGNASVSTRDEVNYKYLTCPHCQQEMRVPRGKGKIAVKCPKCKESTITES